MDGQAAHDKLEIQELLYRYAWACDNADWSLLRSIFTDDAYLDYSSTQGPAGTRDEITAWLEKSLSQVEMIQHVVSNIQIDLEGDRAGVRAMFYCSVKLPGIEQITITGGYYHDEVVRTPEGWRIARLVEDNRWMTNPPAQAPAAGGRPR